MRVVIQRVSEACVAVPAESYESSIGAGLLVLAAFIDEDTEEDLEWTAKKIAGMRIFDDEAGVMFTSLFRSSASRYKMRMGAQVKRATIGRVQAKAMKAQIKLDQA